MTKSNSSEEKRTNKNTIPVLISAGVGFLIYYYSSVPVALLIFLLSLYIIGKWNEGASNRNNMNIGIIIFGILSIVFSIYIMMMVAIPRFLYPSHSHMFAAAYFITAICWMIFGIGVLKRLSWARIGLIFVAIIYIADSFDPPSFLIAEIKNNDIWTLTTVSLGLIFFISLIVFFTRPKIKKIFDKELINGE
jgi:hypothetical protein